MDIEQLKEEVFKCEKCDLSKTKTHYVFGEGNKKAKIMFIGEAPGANEDKQGRPFVGRAGGIFDELLTSINIERGDIYIANILKCRPPGNRNPSPTEIISCTSFLNSQIMLINPKIICPMGNYASQFIMKKYGLHDKLDGISKLHGQTFVVSTITGKISIIPLYHPAVATYNPDMKNILLKDIKSLKGA